MHVKRRAYVIIYTTIHAHAFAYGYSRKRIYGSTQHRARASAYIRTQMSVGFGFKASGEGGQVPRIMFWTTRLAQNHAPSCIDRGWEPCKACTAAAMGKAQGLRQRRFFDRVARERVPTPLYNVATRRMPNCKILQPASKQRPRLATAAMPQSVRCLQGDANKYRGASALGSKECQLAAKGELRRKQWRGGRCEVASPMMVDKQSEVFLAVPAKEAAPDATCNRRIGEPGGRAPCISQGAQYIGPKDREKKLARSVVAGEVKESAARSLGKFGRSAQLKGSVQNAARGPTARC